MTRYTLGPRGFEMMEAERVHSNVENDPLLNAPVRSFPLYDGHGNMTGTLKRSGYSYGLANKKRYEVWGTVRSDSGASGGQILNPKNRYVANLGHHDDPLLGLTYMRARWYEPGTGRFVSEDPAKDGSNWFVYAGGNPVAKADANGRHSAWAALLAGVLSVIIAGAIAGNSGLDPVKAIAAFVSGVAGYYAALASGPVSNSSYLVGLSSVAAKLAGYTISGILNATATYVIAMITSADCDAGDFFLAFLAGGFSGAAASGLGGGTGPAQDMTIGAFSSGVQGLFSSMKEFFKR